MMCRAQARVIGSTRTMIPTQAARTSAAGITAELPFFADQSVACVSEYNACMSECAEIGVEASWGEDLWESSVSVCLEGPLHGGCPSYVQNLEACGGELRNESYGQLELRCQSTWGAFNDDLEGLCGRDNDFGDCSIDIAAAGEACGGVSMENEACLSEWLIDHWAVGCEEDLIVALEEA